MKSWILLSPGLMTAALMMSGCAKATDDATPSARETADSTGMPLPPEHTHGTGPNGGVVFDLGSHHAEFTVDDPKKECTILVLGDDEKTPAAVGAPQLILNIQETKTAEGTVVAPMTITMSPVSAADGKASKFVGTDPGIGNVADFAGTVSGEIDGKPAMGEFAE